MFIYILILIFIGFIVFLYLKSQSFYPYKTSSDYQYNFDEHFIIDYKNNKKIHLPEKIKNYQTCFIKLKVKSSLLGYFIQPYIEIEHEGTIFKQYLEHGSKGFRYVNISGIDNSFLLKGKRIKITSKKLAVTTFNNETLTNKKILVISPHPDDAEIAAYGLYSKYSENVFILTVSAGEKGNFKYRELYNNKKEQHYKKGELRVWNALTVPLLAGVPPDNIATFGLFDDTLEDLYENKNEIVKSKILDTKDVTIFTKQNFSKITKELTHQSNWNSFVKNLEHIIQNFNPEIIVTPYPYIDVHEDHQYSTIACIEALKNLNISNGKLFLYTNHYTDAEYYPFGKTGSIMSIPPKFDNSIYFDKIYSHKLSLSEQNDKILAFDAMNDLRPNTEYRLWYKLLANGFTRLRAQLFSIEKDYFNRYVRSNELFFVVDIQKIYNNNILKQLMSQKFKDKL